MGNKKASIASARRRARASERWEVKVRLVEHGFLATAELYTGGIITTQVIGEIRSTEAEARDALRQQYTNVRAKPHGRHLSPPWE